MNFLWTKGFQPALTNLTQHPVLTVLGTVFIALTPVLFVNGNFNLSMPQIVLPSLRMATVVYLIFGVLLSGAGFVGGRVLGNDTGGGYWAGRRQSMIILSSIGPWFLLIGLALLVVGLVR
jgi:hypothetical protein